MSAAISASRPVEVPVSPAGPQTGLATVAIILVTWNRKSDVSNVLAALSRQDYPRERMHVMVVDNNSTDGTSSFLVQRWNPEALIENPTDKAHEPRFERPLRPGAPDRPNDAGFASLTIIHNHSNMGGCGGFNTGLGYVSSGGLPIAGGSPDFVWLVDDDVDLPTDALSQLTRAAATDPKIGMVGSRTVDLGNRRTTIESTIYYDRERGIMADEPPAGHPRAEEHKRWIEQVGGPRGDRTYTGLRDVDVVSACSLLARWNAVEKIGLWDYRYFIYCDDADWCLRFGKAGYRVVLNLDAVVYHTPWNMKLTVARIYYAQRNALWMAQKVLPVADLRRMMFRQMRSILRDSLRASIHRRLFHADIIRRTALDVATNHGGKLDADGPTPEPVVESLRRAGALKKDRWVSVLCSAHPSIGWADSLRAHVRDHLDPHRGDEMPRWAYYVRNDVPDHGGHAEGPESRPDRIVYSTKRRSRYFRRQLPVFNRRPTGVVVFDQTTDFPSVLGRWNIHIDTRKPQMAQLERDGWGRKIRFFARWTASAVRCTLFARSVGPYTSPTKYG